MTATARKIAVLFYNTLRTACTTEIRAQTTMSDIIAAVCSATFNAGPNRWASCYRPFQATIRLFLRKAAAYFAKEST